MSEKDKAKTSSTEPAPEGAKADKTVKAKAKRAPKKARAQMAQGRIYIQATYNNTIVTFADLNGNVLGWSSAGVVGFRGPKKATPYAASVIVRDVAEKVKDVGMKEAFVYIAGPGQGREGALRALNANGITVLSIKDVTPVPHNGCRPSRPRRM